MNVGPVDVGPLSVGPLTLDPPVVLAPMAGVTNAAFRTLCRAYGGGLYVSEMVMARALLQSNERTTRMVSFAEGESPRSVQLYTVDPKITAMAVTHLVDEVGVDHVDLNFGCPAAKVTRKGGGAALPLHRALYQSIVAAAVTAAGEVPVTVKLRIGVDDGHRTFLDAGRVAEGEGVAAVALHARTAEQLYSGAADWSAIAALKEAVTTVPVLGNGDIWEADDAVAMVAATGCDGVVVGRGCLGRPWLFRDLADAFTGRPRQEPPDLGAVVDTMRAHADLLCELMDERFGIRDFRKHVGWYLQGFPLGGELRHRLAQVSSLAELDALVAPLDRSTPFPAHALRLPRGHTNGPRRVALPERWLETLDDPVSPSGADVLVSGG